MISANECVLTIYESRMLTWVGRKRFENAVRNHRNPGDGPSSSGPEHHIRGTHCEYASSIIFNLYWRPAIGELERPDVGGLLEVRSTDLEHGRLIVKPNDDDDAPFVLIEDMGNLHYRAVGWLYARQAKQFPLERKWLKRWSRWGDPAHYVSRQDLANLAALHELIELEREDA